MHIKLFIFCFLKCINLCNSGIINEDIYFAKILYNAFNCIYYKIFSCYVTLISLYSYTV